MRDQSHEAIHGTWKSYILGFVLSILFTLATYFIVVEHLFSTRGVVIASVVLALAQAVVQLLLFLHLAEEPKPRSNLFMFLLVILILIIVVLGSLWIMYDLNDRMMHMGTQ